MPKVTANSDGLGPYKMTLVPTSILTSQHREFHPRSLLKSKDGVMRGYLPFCCQPSSALGHDKGARHQEFAQERDQRPFLISGISFAAHLWECVGDCGGEKSEGTGQPR